MADVSSVNHLTNRREVQHRFLHEEYSASTENTLGRSRTCSRNYDHGWLNHYNTLAEKGIIYK